MNECFFITGTLRSGTTLLNKILNSPTSYCASQSLTEVFMNEKRNFHRQRGMYTYHLLSNYFPAPYDFNEFNSYLSNSSFSNTYKKSVSAFTDTNTLAGDKEVLCEEFIPHLLDNNIKVILCIRHPNDMIASMHTGSGYNFAGAHRPVLFDLRNWRKSIAFGIRCKQDKNFLLVKYEDLVLNPKEELPRIEEFLNVKLLDNYNQIYDGGKVWSGNSSFTPRIEGISKESVGISEIKLSTEVRKFTEETCYAEMVWATYLKNEGKTFNYELIRSFKDPYSVNRPEFDEFNYSEELNREIIRLQELSGSKTENENANFIFPEAFRELSMLIN